MAESNQRSKIVKLLSSLDAIPVENPVYPGTPDVNYMDGWIELKWLREWPKRPTTTVKFDHYTQQQRIWAKHHTKKGRKVWFLAQCRREWLLLTGIKAAEVVNHTTKEELIQEATHYWTHGINKQELITCLTS